MAIPKQPMITIIDIIFIVGLLTNLLKGADFILRPSQQKWIQQQFDSITLWLEYTRPLRWYVNLTNSQSQALLMIVSSILLLVEVVYFPNMVAFLLLPVLSNYVNQIWKILNGVLSSVFTLVFMWYVGRRVAKLFFDNDGYISLIAKSSLLIILGFSSLCIVLFCVGIVYLVMESFTNVVVAEYIASFSSFVFVPLVTLLNYLIFLVSILLFASMILWILELLLKITRVIAWRIVEYNRGAYSAIVLIVTIIIGAFDFYLKQRK